MIFWHNCLISEPIFKLFVAPFRTHELQKDDMVIFFLWSFRKVRFRKMQFLKDGMQTVAFLVSDLFSMSAMDNLDVKQNQLKFYYIQTIYISIFIHVY